MTGGLRDDESGNQGSRTLVVNGIRPIGASEFDRLYFAC